MAIPSSWAPPNETAADLWLERSNFDSVVLSSTAYGVHLTLYMIVMQHFLNHKVKSTSTWCFMAYISWNFILGTFGISAEAKFNELTFVDARNYPGGPNAFVSAQYNDFINLFGTAAYVVLNWFADGLVIYRFWLIFDFNYYIVVLPSLLLAGSFSMGVILLFQLSQPNANLWTVTTVNFGIPYWSLSTALNILVTSMIVARLLYIRTTIRKVLASDYGRTYVSVATMLIESAALYSITALIFIVTYARNSNVQNLVLPVLGQVQAISPLLIMWRVAQGNAWTRTTASQITTETKISWAHNETMSGSQDLTSKSESNVASHSFTNVGKSMKSKRRTKRGSQEADYQLDAINVPGHRRSNSRRGGLTLTTLPVLNEKDTSPRMVNITLPERAQTFNSRRFANIGQTASGNSGGDYETEWSPSPIDSAVDRKPLDVPDWTTTVNFGYLNAGEGEKQSDSSASVIIHHDSDADQDPAGATVMREQERDDHRGIVDGDSLGSGVDVDRLRGDGHGHLSTDVAGKSV